MSMSIAHAAAAGIPLGTAVAVHVATGGALLVVGLAIYGAVKLAEEAGKTA